jgi:hypothetical protein
MPLAEDEALVLTPTAAISSWHSPKRSLVMCTPPEARGSILRDCFHLWRVGHPTGREGRIKAPFAGTTCSTSFLKPLLFEHGREAHSPECVEGEFYELCALAHIYFLHAVISYSSYVQRERHVRGRDRYLPPS